MKLYILNNGSIHGPWSIFYTKRKESPKETYEFPCSVFLLDTPQGKILYDTGIHPGGIHAKSISYRYQTRQQTLKRQLALCNTTVDEIKMVILSHMHYDHAGGLFIFSNAEIVVSHMEYDYAWKMVTNHEGMPDDNAYCRSDFDVPVSKWTLLEEDTEIVPGVEAVFLPGHTPGLMGLVVHLDSKTFILPQDSLYTSRNFGPPAVRSGLVFSEKAFYESVEKVRAIKEKYNAEIIYGHDMTQRNTLKMAPECYE